MSLARGKIIGLPYYCKSRGRFLRSGNKRIILFPAQIVAVPRGQDAVIVKYLDRRPPYPVAVSLNEGLVLHEGDEPSSAACLCKDFYKLISQAPPYRSALARLSGRTKTRAGQFEKPCFIRRVGPRTWWPPSRQLDTSREMGDHWFQLGQRALRFQL